MRYGMDSVRNNVSRFIGSLAFYMVVITPKPINRRLNAHLFTALP